MNGNAYAVMKEAILKKLQVNCFYHDFQREVCPHALGKKKGKLHVLTFQFAGRSRTSLPPGGEWRCMDVEEIYGASSHSGKWHTGLSQRKPQNCVDEIDVEVSF